MTATPRAVLDAGKRERERWFIYAPDGDDGCSVLRDGQHYVGEFTGTRAVCQDLIDDRVFQAMLRAQLQDLDTDNRTSVEVLIDLLALAGDDHG